MEIALRTYQVKAMEAIQNALNRKQNHIVVEMVAGSGKGIILTKIIELLNRLQPGMYSLSQIECQIRKE